mgnify:CR=1 FL=1
MSEGAPRKTSRLHQVADGGTNRGVVGNTRRNGVKEEKRLALVMVSIQSTHIPFPLLSESLNFRLCHGFGLTNLFLAFAFARMRILGTEWCSHVIWKV